VSGESVSSDDEEPLAVNVKSTALEGTITIGGDTPPLSVYDDGEIYLRNAAGDRVSLSRTRSGTYSRRLVELQLIVRHAAAPFGLEVLDQILELAPRRPKRLAGLVFRDRSCPHALGLSSASLVVCRNLSLARGGPLSRFRQLVHSPRPSASRSRARCRSC